MDGPATPQIDQAGCRRLLVGWLAVAVWIAYAVGSRLGFAAPPGLAAVYWIGAVLVAMHFGLSYHLAYSGGLAAVRSRPVALVLGPLLLLAAVGAAVGWSLAAGTAAAQHLTAALVTSVYLMTTWHYIKQVLRRRPRRCRLQQGVADGWDVRVLRYGLYPLWFLGAGQILLRGSIFTFAGFRVGYPLLPQALYAPLRVLAIATAVPIVGVLAGIAARERRMPPSLLVAPYAAALLWLALPTTPALTLLLLAPFHALQYLAVGHRAEVAVASTRPGEHGAMWWLNIFGGAAAGGLLVSRWLPTLLDSAPGWQTGLCSSPRLPSSSSTCTTT